MSVTCTEWFTTCTCLLSRIKSKVTASQYTCITEMLMKIGVKPIKTNTDQVDRKSKLIIAKQYIIYSESKKKEAKDMFELPTKGKASRASLSRADMILNNSMAVVKERDQIKEETNVERQGVTRPEITAQLAGRILTVKYR